MSNRLAAEKSPYLLQHADNPVDWYPWGAEALERAASDNRPLLVSIGYSACHWCHVMAHESFEDEATAALMNTLFVNVKVDREERPDVDSIYMDAVQAMTGQGGWPLNVFLTPDGRPFYGGTYFPPESRHGLPSWKQVLTGVSDAFRERHDEVSQSADALTEYIGRVQGKQDPGADLSPALLSSAGDAIKGQQDWTSGGFGGAPKFPQPLALELTLRLYRRTGEQGYLDFAQLTLGKMAAGGIFDHLGGGFHRYTVDGQWVVPHFEKMLYDNALLIPVYLHAWQLTRDLRWRTVVEETSDYLIRDMRSPEGGFYSAEDADSEGEEGKFYVWTPEEVQAALTAADADLFCRAYGIRPGGNFEGKTILTRAVSTTELASTSGLESTEIESSLAAARARLVELRSTRVRPGMDTKILAGWNGLAIRALAEAGRVLERPDYLDAAAAAATFVWYALRPNARLVRSYRDGASAIPAFLEDYAFLVEAYLSLYETTFNHLWFERAQYLADEMLDLFWDKQERTFFDSPADADPLVVRPRSLFDNPIPSGSSAATLGLLRLNALTATDLYSEIAGETLKSARELMARAPLGLPYFLCALDFYLTGATQIALVGSDERELRPMLRPLFDTYLPNAVIAVGEDGSVPLLSGRDRVGGLPTAHVCRQFACRLPTNDPDTLTEQLAEEAR